MVKWRPIAPLFLVLGSFSALAESTDQWWLRLAQKQGPMVCVEEEILENQRYFDTPWTGGKLCGTEAIVRFACCHGYGRVPGERGCPLVNPLENLADTARSAGAGRFVAQAELSGLLPLLTHRGAFTLFAPRDEAFSSLTPQEEKALNSSSQSRSRPPLLLYSLAESRISASALPDQLSTLYRQGSILVNKFPSGLVTVNCIPLVATDLEASNGLVHVTESLLLPPEHTTITDLLVRSQPLSTLATAIVRAQLTSELRDKGPITLFAPVDPAWEALPQNFMETLMEDVDSLKALLHYHMVESVWCSAAAGGDSELRTLEGSTVQLWCNTSGQFINDAHVIEGDHVAGNGFVHHIDTVLIPDRVRSLSELMESRGITYFLQMIERGGLLATLQRHGTYTVFAPSDEAFEALSNDTRTELLTNSALARSTASFHIVSGRQLTSNFIDGQTLSTLRGQQTAIRVKMHRKRVTLETSLVTSPDVEARNGVLHVLDRLLLPPASTIAQILKQDGNFSSFVDILNQTEPNLLKTLDNTSAIYTVFAPDNRALNETPPGMLTRLMADPPLLFTIAAHHIIPAYAVTCGLEPKLTYQHVTVSGRPVTLRREDGGSVTVARLASVEEGDVTATNGVIHRVSRLLEL